MRSVYPVNTLERELSYDEYWRAKRPGNLGMLSSFQRRRAEIVQQFIDRGATVLDIGCGDGAILSYLREQKQIHGIAVDSSELAISHAASLGFETIKIDCNDTSSLSRLPTIDYILLLEVLEHLPRPEEVLAALRSKCTKAMIVSVPNSGYYVHRLRFLSGRFPLQWIAHPGEHLRFWTLADFRWWIRALKFKFAALKCYEGIPVLNKLWPSLFAAGIVARLES